MTSISALSGLGNPFSGLLTVVRRRSPAQAAPVPPVPAVDAPPGRPRGLAGRSCEGCPATAGQVADRLELSPAALRTLSQESPRTTTAGATHSPAAVARLDLYA
jgi:hypothetical protein